MSEQRQSATGVYLAIALLVCLPPLYVLSIGPVGFILDAAGVEHDDWLAHFARACYWPLLWLHDNNTVAREWLEWYLKLWGEP
jgi:hypothetical protein